MTHEMAWALFDAGYLTHADYLALCAINNWPTTR